MTRPVTPDGGSLSGAEVLTLLRNVGVDPTCGACVEVAYTGATLAGHTCRPPPKADAVSTHLGDGLYAGIEHGRVVLRANSHLPDEATDTVYLEPEVCAALLRFLRVKGWTR